MDHRSANSGAAAEPWLGERMDVQLRLALLDDASGGASLVALVDEARRAGLSGAEIDAAMAGRSFEVRTAALLAFARALRAGDQPDVERMRQACLRLGFPSLTLDQVARDRALRPGGAR